MKIESAHIDESRKSVSAGQISCGDIANQFTVHRDRLIQIIGFRLDRRLLTRIDADDVLQEAYLESSKRRSFFRPDLTLFVQIRQLLLQTITDIHRRHIKVQGRSVFREVALESQDQERSSTNVLARLLHANVSTPSSPLRRAETIFKLENALQSLNVQDVEILLMRHFEDLTNLEVAQTLGIRPDTACQRYLRALSRLESVLSSMSHFEN